VVQFHFDWKHISLIAGMHLKGVCFRMHDGSIKKQEVLAFLRALRAHFRQRLLIIWDRARAHCSRLVRDYVDSTNGHINVELLPAYAPEINPVEFLWAWLKRHALANFCPDTLTDLRHNARSKLKSAQHRSGIVASCWAQAELF
jgi:transposase